MKKKPAKKKTELKTRVAIVLDRSGSMVSIRTEIIGAFNEQVKAIQETAEGIDTKVSLFTFSTVADEPVLWNEDVKKLKPLGEGSYMPDGLTAMNDSVGMALERLTALPEANEKETSFLLIIISDGLENNSKKYDGPVIAQRLKELQATKRWTVTYLGANVDAQKVAASMNIARGNTMGFAASAAGVRRLSDHTSVGTRSYMSSRASGQSATANFFQDDDETKKEKKP